MKIGTNDISKIYLGSAEIEKIYLGTSQVYEGEEPTPVPYEEQYLTIESTSDNNTIYWKKRNSSVQGKTISASTDNGSTWTSYTSASGNGITIATLNSGDKLLVKGENATYYESWHPQGIFASTANFIVYGNIMSLVYGDNFSGQTTLTSGHTFESLFGECTGLTSAENLILSATTLTYSCYSWMFNGCTSLTTAPELPATTLESNCYEAMFYGCTSLTTAPTLPATTLSDGCYQEMFAYCTNLTTAPELPATTLIEMCYMSMFQGCTSLNYIKCLATDISAMDCTFYWLDGVASTGTFVKAASMSSWTTGTAGIPTGWTVQNDDGSPYINDNWDDQE